MYNDVLVKYRSAYATFRCGVAPIRMDTGRYGANRVRLKHVYVCNVVESKMNFMLLCNAHSMMMYDPAALILYTYYVMNLTN